MNRLSVVRRGTRVLQGILAPLGPRDPQDQLGHQAMDRRESLAQRAPKEFPEPLDHLETPVLEESSVFQRRSQGSQDPQGPQATLAPEAHLASRENQENVSQVLLGLTGIQEFQELDSLGLLGLKETEVFRELKEHQAVPEKWGSQGYLEIQASQEPRENQD